MQTFQTRQILDIIKAKVSRENSVFNVTLHGKTKRILSSLVLFHCCVEQAAS